MQDADPQNEKQKNDFHLQFRQSQVIFYIRKNFGVGIMQTMKKIRAALDFSWNEASLALADENDQVLASEKFLLSGHDASSLPDRLEKALRTLNRDLSSVGEWTVGTGPGGFTGLRVASALVIGLAYGVPETRVRGMSSAAGLARSAFSEKSRPEKVLALFDGRRSELLAYGLALEKNSYLHNGYTAVFHTPEDLAKALKEYSCAALEKDRDAIRKFAPEAEEQIVFTPSINAEELIFNDPENFSASPTDLIYLRAAVFVAPRIPRQI